MTASVRIALIPRDGLFCKDGKGWHTSASGRGHGLEWPWPSTVLGAIRSAWGRAQEEKEGTCFGPHDWRTRTAPIQLGRTLVVRRQHKASWKADHLVWPVPADAVWRDGRSHVQRLEPMSSRIPTLGRDHDEARESLWRPALGDAGKPLVPPRWWSHDDCSTWLAGCSVPIRDPEHTLALARRFQAHVGILPEKLTAQDGVLFAHDVVETLETRAEWAIGIEATLPAGALPDVALLGADGRIACIEPLPDTLFDPPTQVIDAFCTGSAGLRLVTVTPICFEKGWLPDGLVQHGDEYRGQLPGLEGELILRAAFIPRPIHVSGWDMAAGTPKPTSRMVAPGGVYFFEHANGKPFGRSDACGLWLAALGSRTEEGFGRVVPGVWNPRSDTP